MQYHSQQFTQIAEAAAVHIRPLILQTIKNLATDFRAQFPEVKRIRDHFGTPQIVTKTYIPIEADKKNQYTTPFTLFLLDVAMPLTITLQPEILVDGVPIEEAIQDAQQKTYSVHVIDGNHSNGNHQEFTLYCGTDFDAAKRILAEWIPPFCENPSASISEWAGGKLSKEYHRNF